MPELSLFASRLAGVVVLDALLLVGARPGTDEPTGRDVAAPDELVLEDAAPDVDDVPEGEDEDGVAGVPAAEPAFVPLSLLSVVPFASAGLLPEDLVSVVLVSVVFAADDPVVAPGDLDASGDLDAEDAPAEDVLVGEELDDVPVEDVPVEDVLGVDFVPEALLVPDGLVAPVG